MMRSTERTTKPIIKMISDAKTIKMPSKISIIDPFGFEVKPQCLPPYDTHDGHEFAQVGFPIRWVERCGNEGPQHITENACHQEGQQGQ
jgi:hypothetical protein